MPFQNEIAQISPEQLEQLFDSAPAGTPNADTLTVGKEHTTVIDNDKVPTLTTTQVVGPASIPFYDPAQNAEPIVDDKDTKGKPTDAVVDATKPTATVEEGQEGKTKDGEATKTDEVEIDTNSIDEVLTNTVDYLIKSGKWVDFEGREDLKITQEVYADLAAKQDDYRLSQMFNELIDSTGDYGKAIINHVKNGGNPDEIIDLFKEQKQIQQIDTTTELGKQAKIEKYYSDILGWKPEKVEKTIKRLITDNEIESEFTDVSELYDQHFKDQLAKTEQAELERKEETKQRQAVFVNNIKSAIKENTTLTDNERRLIESSVLSFRHKLPDGQKVNDFYIKFAEKQADPKEYVDIVRFIMDKEGYLKSIKRAEETKANNKAFSFIKGGAAIAKVKSSPIEINENSRKVQQGTDFSFALKK